MKKALWIAAGLIAGAIAFWPAAFFESAALRALPAGSSVALSGSIWSGRGHLQTGGTTWPLEWRYLPSRLLNAALAWNVESNPHGAQASAQVSIGFGGFAVRSPAFDGEIRALHAWIPALKLTGVQGRARVDAPEMEISPSTPWRANGEGRMTLSELSVAAIGGSTLGTHELAIKGGGESVAFEIVKSEGTLKLEGQGRINNAGEYVVQGSALPLVSFDADSRARLARFATAQSDGRFRFDARGKW